MDKKKSRVVHIKWGQTIWKIKIKKQKSPNNNNKNFLAPLAALQTWSGEGTDGRRCTPGRGLLPLECPTAVAVQKATCHAREGRQILPGAGVSGGILGGFPGIQCAAGKNDLLHVNGMKGLGEGGK